MPALGNIVAYVWACWGAIWRLVLLRWGTAADPASTVEVVGLERCRFPAVPAVVDGVAVPIQFQHPGQLGFLQQAHGGGLCLYYNGRRRRRVYDSFGRCLGTTRCRDAIDSWHIAIWQWSPRAIWQWSPRAIFASPTAEALGQRLGVRTKAGWLAWGGAYALGLPVSLARVLATKQSPSLVVVLLTLHGRPQCDLGHANVLFFDRANRTAQRFDPLDPFNGHPQLDQALTTVCRVEYGYTYLAPLGAALGLAGSMQSLEIRDPRGDRLPTDPVGFCAAWSLFMAEFRLANPELAGDVALATALRFLANRPESRTVFIRSYSVRVLRESSSLATWAWLPAELVGKHAHGLARRMREWRRWRQWDSGAGSTRLKPGEPGRGQAGREGEEGRDQSGAGHSLVRSACGPAGVN